MKLIILLPIHFFFFFPLAAQNSEDLFLQSYKQFNDLNSLTFNGSFEGRGSNAGNVVKAEGRIALQKKDSSFKRYRSFAIAEIALIDNIVFEEVMYNGNELFRWNPEKNIYENKGTFPEAHKYSGYSTILYSNLKAHWREFNKNVHLVKYEETSNGHKFTIPGNEKRGKMIMYFDKGSKVPKKAVRYNEKENYQDFVQLTLSGIRTDIDFPESYFTLPQAGLSSIADSSSAEGTKYLKEFSGQNADLLEVGTKAPEWELKNSKGVKKKLSDYKGKIVLMDFWATWCAPCIQAQPMLQKIHENYENVVVLGMNYQDKKDLDLFRYKVGKKLDYEMMLNAENIGSDYLVRALPVAYLIDQTGVIVYAGLGYSDTKEAELISTIENLKEKN